MVWTEYIAPTEVGLVTVGHNGECYYLKYENWNNEKPIVIDWLELDDLKSVGEAITKMVNTMTHLGNE